MYTDTTCAEALLKQLPGKSGCDDGRKWLPVWIHSRDTAAMMSLLLTRWVPDRIKQSLGLGDRLVAVCEFLALVHDVGKLTPAFLVNILESLPEMREKLAGMGVAVDGRGELGFRLPHALAGAVILQECSCPAGVVAVVGAHHGKPISETEDCDLPELTEFYSKSLFWTGRDSKQGRLWAEVRALWLAEALKLAGFAIVEDIPPLGLREQMLLTGLLIMADWLASNPDYFPLLDMEDTGEGLDLERRAADAWDRFDPGDLWTPPVVDPEGNWFKSTFGFEPNQEQRTMIRVAEDSFVPGIYILEAQMGRGKTEAALAAAELLAGKLGCGGLFFGLPTQATANGVFPRLKIWGAGQAGDMDLTIRLAHGMAALNEEYRALFSGRSSVDEDGEGGLLVHPWFTGRKQVLLSDFVIGTIDQFLMAGLKQKHLMLRHLGLAGKVVILDECHAYDAYMNQYLNRVLNWMGAYGVLVIILSATLPAARRAALVDAYQNRSDDSEKSGAWRTCRGYPLLTWTQGEQVLQETIPVDTPDQEVVLGRLEEENLTEWLRDMLSQGGCAGVIVNTVRRAQELAKRLESDLPHARVELFHSQFILPDRAEKEARLVEQVGRRSTAEQRNLRIVVGTQVLEQSLDIDFDCLATDLCPMDLLLQRIGRLHRHDRRDRPKRLRRPICMVMGAGETLEAGSERVYGKWLLLRTKELLPDRIVLPKSIPELVQKTYAEPDTALLEPDMKTAWESFVDEKEKKERRADAFRLESPKESEEDTINGWLDRDVTGSDARAEARVRDSDSSVSVLLLRRDAEDRVFFLPWQENGREIPTDRPPEEPVARAIAAQKIRLPFSLSVGKRGERVVDLLEQEYMRYVPMWQGCGWLKEELILFLDDDLTQELDGVLVRYDRKWGLCIEKRE